MPIRPATPDDAEAIAAIYNDAIVNSTAILWREPKPVSLWRDRLADRPARFPVFVAEEGGGAVIGFALLGPYDDKCGYEDVAEWSVYLEAGSRGLGIGRRLSEAVIEAGRSAGLHSVLSRVTEGNAASERLHAALGFREVGRFEKLGSKFGQRLDVIAYQRVL
ncbi:MAG: GNAT family N-acetyltransferase [Phycisphaeraceae bacterium]